MAKNILFADLFVAYPTLQLNGITKNRAKEVPIGKRGGRVRAFLMTEHYEIYFQQLQALRKPIPDNLFHSAVYGDEIMKNVIDIHLRQTKYIRMNVLEVWTQYELRRQIEIYHHEYVNKKSVRAQKGFDIHMIISWWYDTKIGIEARIRQYNAKVSQLVPFEYQPERKIVLKSRNQRSSRKRKMVAEEPEPELESELESETESDSEVEVEPESKPVVNLESDFDIDSIMECFELTEEDPEAILVYLNDDDFLEEFICDNVYEI